ncbi:MAG: site-specific integrase, partial [Candidatus Amulumruptor sp.]|nr:site-specific integrase [Candidatus Amulumruptor sp.]
MMTALARFISYLRDELRYSPNTVEAYRRDIESWLEHFGDSRPIEAATQADIRSYIAAEAKSGLSIASLRRRCVALRSLFRFLMHEGTITANPVSGINPGRLPKRLPVNVKPEETASMLDGMAENDGDFTAVRNRLIMEMLYETGMRSAEIMGLRDDQVDTRRQELRVLGKRNKERIIPFGASLAGLIDEYREARLMPGGPGAADSGQPMFVRPDGRPLYRKLVYNIVHSAM